MKRIALGLSAAVLLLVPAAPATLIRKLSLAEVESYASEFFIGTVRSKRCVAIESGKIPVYPEVVFDRLEILKGRITATTATYSFAGGCLGKQRVAVLGIPSFELGDRVVLFANAKLDWYCPAVGWWQGRYRVVKLAKSGEESVCDSAGRPVYGFEKGRPLTSPEKEGQRPMLLSAFKAGIAELIRERVEREKEKAKPPEKKGGAK